MAIWSKPTLETKFHIDNDWWRSSGRNFRLVLLEQLCDKCKQRFRSHAETEMVDWVNPDTGEVTEADALIQCLKRECADNPDFIDQRIPLATAAFRVFLINDNIPLSAHELHAFIPWKQPETILQTLGGRTTYLGIRPA
jgi:hypothetical protein